MERNIYKIGKELFITSDEESEGGDYIFWEGKNFKYREFMTMKTPVYTDYFKIILTDNKDLIKDGVQAIDNEFLQWLVKNPSCEKVEVEYQTTGLKNGVWQYDYKIIIPTEKLKQETIEEATENTHNKEYVKQIFFEAIKVTGEGWNGEYAEGNNPIIEEVFNEEFEKWFNRFKNK